MSARHWLIKFAPFRTSWSEIVARGGFTLRGVRSPEARKHLQAMHQGDQVLFYQSQKNQAIVGLLEVAREAYPDPTSPDPLWLTCDFRPLKTLARALTLAEMRTCKSLVRLPLLTQPQLAVMPLSKAEYETIITLESAHFSEAKP